MSGPSFVRHGHHRWLQCAVLTAFGLVFGCGKRLNPTAWEPESNVGSSPAKSVGSTSTSPSALKADLTTAHFERFIDAKFDGTALTVAGITRDRRLVRGTYDRTLKPQQLVELGSDVEATEQTEVKLAGIYVLVRGKWKTTAGIYAFGIPGTTDPKLVGADACVTSFGLAYTSRSADGIRVHMLRGKEPFETTAGPYPLGEGEVGIVCGKFHVALMIRDAEHLTLRRMDREGNISGAIEGEGKEEVDEELRERTTLVRDNGDLVVVRFSNTSMRVREIAEDGTAAPYEVVRKFVLRDDDDVLEVLASPVQHGPIFVVLSEPMTGTCKGGDPPRKVTLSSLRKAPELPHFVAEKRNVVELPCGLDAIRSQSTAEADRLVLAWTEPVMDRCAEVGLGVGGLVEATSDNPRVKRVDVLAEFATRLQDGRFLTVVRPGGCAPYVAPNAGQLAWAPELK